VIKLDVAARERSREKKPTTTKTVSRCTSVPQSMKMKVFQCICAVSTVSLVAGGE